LRLHPPLNPLPSREGKQVPAGCKKLLNSCKNDSPHDPASLALIRKARQRSEVRGSSFEA